MAVFKGSIETPHAVPLILDPVQMYGPVTAANQWRQCFVILVSVDTVNALLVQSPYSGRE